MSTSTSIVHPSTDFQIQWSCATWLTKHVEALIKKYTEMSRLIEQSQLPTACQYDQCYLNDTKELLSQRRERIYPTLSQMWTNAFQWIVTQRGLRNHPHRKVFSSKWKCSPTKPTIAQEYNKSLKVKQQRLSDDLGWGNRTFKTSIRPQVLPLSTYHVPQFRGGINAIASPLSTLFMATAGYVSKQKITKWCAWIMSNTIFSMQSVIPLSLMSVLVQVKRQCKIFTIRRNLWPMGHTYHMGKDGALYIDFGFQAFECSEFRVTIDVAFSSPCLLFCACNAVGKTTFIPKRNKKLKMTTTKHIVIGRLQDLIHLGWPRLSYRGNMCACRPTQQNEKREAQLLRPKSGKVQVKWPVQRQGQKLRDHCIFFIVGTFVLQPEDTVCEIRRTNGGGVSSTKGDVWGASCVVRATQGSGQRLTCWFERDNLGHCNILPRVAKGCSENRRIFSTRRAGSRVGHAGMT